MTDDLPEGNTYVGPGPADRQYRRLAGSLGTAKTDGRPTAPKPICIRRKAEPIRVLVVVGTRPEAIKLAPVVLALHKEDRFEAVVVTTGQHRQMVNPILSMFGIDAHHDLGIGRQGQSLAHITTGALTGLDQLITERHPALIMVQGDTSTAFAGALAGFYHRLPVAHVEAGLRSGHRWQPFPEEINRRLTTSLATLHLAPTPANVANLLAEGVPRDAIVCTGNTVIDALYHVAALPLDNPAPVLKELLSTPQPLVLITIHRRESWGQPITAVARALRRLAHAMPNSLFVLPAHPNPTVRRSLLPSLKGIDNIRIVEPLGYRDFVALLTRADLILTDSGGIQEEAPSFGTPVLVLRDVTERPEGVAAGLVELVGTNEEHIVARATAILTALEPTRSQRSEHRTVNPYGDGHAATRSVAAVAHLLGQGDPPEDFARQSNHPISATVDR